MFICLAEIKHPKVTETISDIHNNLIGLCLIQNKLISFLTEPLHQFHKSIGSKCIMLRGDTKPLLFRLIIYVPGFQKSHLLYHLTCISQKLHTFRSQCNARPAAVKNSDPGFIFHIFDRPGKTWL